MPAPICIMASVMMKDGMPISVMPDGIDQAQQEAADQRQDDGEQPRQRHVGDVHVALLQA